MSPERVSVGEKVGGHSMQRDRRRKRLGNQHGGESAAYNLHATFHWDRK